MLYVWEIKIEYTYHDILTRIKKIILKNIIHVFDYCVHLSVICYLSVISILFLIKYIYFILSNYYIILYTKRDQGSVTVACETNHCGL